MSREPSQNVNGRQAAGQVSIPDKSYFKIGEVCKLTGVKQHVLRYWENEFSILRPRRAVSRQRLYRRVDVENIFRIKGLLHDQGFTINGAKKYLARQRKGANKGLDSTLSAPGGKAHGPGDRGAIYQTIKRELCALRELLDRS